MKKILTIVLASAGLFLATSTQAQNRDFNKPDTYPSKEYRSNENSKFAREHKFKHRREMERRRKEFRYARKHHRHHHHGELRKHNGRMS